jgi:hypothetical protein
MASFHTSHYIWKQRARKSPTPQDMVPMTRWWRGSKPSPVSIGGDCVTNKISEARRSKRRENQIRSNLTKNIQTDIHGALKIIRLELQDQLIRKIARRLEDCLEASKPQANLKGTQTKQKRSTEQSKLLRVLGHRKKGRAHQQRTKESKGNL